MRISEVKRQARVAEWVQNIRDQQDSGLTVKAWCADQGYGEGRFFYWLKIVRAAAIERAEQAAQGTSFIRVEPERLPTSIPSPCLPTATTVVSRTLCKLKKRESRSPTVSKDKIEFTPDNRPIGDGHDPFFHNVHGPQEEDFKDGVVVREGGLAVGDLAKSRIEGLDHVGGIDHLADFGGVVKKLLDEAEVVRPDLRPWKNYAAINRLFQCSLPDESNWIKITAEPCLLQL